MQWKLALHRPIAPRASNEETLRRNMRLGVANGVLFILADAFSDANLVLTVFVRELGAAPWVVGLLPSLKSGGWLLPQLLSAGRLQGMTYKLPVYRQVGIVRFFIWLAMVLVVWNATSLPVLVLLPLFLLGYAMYNFTGGSGSVAFQEVVAKTIPARQRGKFFGARNLIGGLLSFALVSPLVGWLLSRTSPLVFPHNYGILLFISFVLIGFGIISFSLFAEPPTTNPPAAISARQMFAKIPVLLKHDRNFRQYVLSRMVTRLGGLADPFYILYAREVLHVSPRMIGVYLAVRVFAAALSNLVWSRIGDQRGNRLLIVLTGALIITVPTWALLIMPFANVLGPEALGWLFGVIFLLIGLSVDGSNTASLTYVMELAPAEQRPVYVGVCNTLMGVATFFPVLGGLLLAQFGYLPLFWISAASAFGGWLLSRRLPEPRTKSIEHRA
ncbi:MFS transporter [Herpetosiphon giganteus]|uniref:MFS transporter n=1 Tax=Herpetosiphon giganteus TaxID=2029754 RepID=UPI00195D8CA3|nr:MFS transporter [Herpetosiphon giganteus]MBM7844270.1 MFS family permease [Herpetosiphon giganteus]